MERSLITWMTDITQPQSHSEVSRWLCVYKPVILKKPGGGIRPILLCTVWKKIMSSAIAQKAQSEMVHLTSSIKFGEHSRKELCNSWTERHMPLHSQRLVAHIDIANAFGSISRSEVLTLLDTHLTEVGKKTWLPWIHQHLAAPIRILADDAGETEDTWYQPWCLGPRWPLNSCMTRGCWNVG
eukprot:3401684-Amphidinium_carterae.1